MILRSFSAQLSLPVAERIDPRVNAAELRQAHERKF